MSKIRKNGMNAEKQNVSGQIVEMYDVKTTADLQDSLKDPLTGVIQSMPDAELDEQIDEREEADPTYRESRNGYKPETLRSSMGDIPIQAPRDRNSDFGPQVVSKHQKGITEIGQKIIAMYARGLTTPDPGTILFWRQALQNAGEMIN